MSLTAGEVIHLTRVLNLVGFYFSAGAIILVFNQRARRECRKRRLSVIHVINARGSSSGEDAPASDPSQPQPVKPEPQDSGAGVEAKDANPRRQNEPRRFLKSAGSVLLVLDLVVAVLGISALTMALDQRHPNDQLSRSRRHLDGLFVESSWLQAGWLLFTHFRIVACVAQRQTEVKGRLWGALVGVVFLWLVVGLLPVELAYLLGVPQWETRKVVSSAGALVGFGLLVYLLWAYHVALRAFQETALAIPTPRKRDRNHRVVRALIVNALVAPGRRLAGDSPLAAASANDSTSTTISEHDSAASSSHRERVHMVEQRLRKALTRVLQLYVATFLCVILSGLIAVGSASIARTLAGQCVMMVLSIPYTLMGVADAYMVGGLGKRHKFTEEALGEIKRRHQRADGELAAEEEAREKEERLYELAKERQNHPQVAAVDVIQP